MSAFFHEVGRRRSKKEEFKMSATGAANKFAFSLSTQEGIPSGPDALFVLSADSFLMTENSDIGQGGSCWCAYACVCTSGVAGGVNALILYFRIPHNTLCLPPKFCINHCFQMLLGICSVPKSI